LDCFAIAGASDGSGFLDVVAALESPAAVARSDKKSRCSRDSRRQISLALQRVQEDGIVRQLETIQLDRMQRLGCRCDCVQIGAGPVVKSRHAETRLYTVA
jgi:hypothetical protein